MSAGEFNDIKTGQIPFVPGVGEFKTGRKRLQRKKGEITLYRLFQNILWGFNKVTKLYLRSSDMIILAKNICSVMRNF